MVLKAQLGEQPVTLSLKPSALTVALDEQTVLAFDRAGRLWSFFTHEHHFRRGLNGSILAKWTADRPLALPARASERQRRRLWHSEADLVVRRAAQIARRLADRLQFQADPETTRAVQTVLGRAATFDIAVARADVERFHQVYKPIGILPPDQYLALVVQMTQGCSFNTCTFCNFYRDRPFRIKSPDELNEHIAAVGAFLGDSITMRRGIFLADANALVAPQRQLVALLDVVNDALGAGQRIFAFLDGFSGEKKSTGDYRALSERGLQRIYVGLESGHDPLLRWLRKPGRAVDAVTTVRRMKAAGVAAGVIVMLGIGGQRYAEGHVHDTIDVVNQMALSRGDLLFFSEFFPYGTPYEHLADARDLWPLSRPQMQAQREAIVAGVRFGDSRPQIATYDIREFIY